MMYKPDTQSRIKALLWAGIEDYCPLYAAIWEMNTLVPSLSDQELFQMTDMLVRSLLDAGYIRLVWVESDGVRPIAIDNALVLLNDMQNWRVYTAQDTQVCLDTTDKGKEYYRAMYNTSSGE